MLGESSEAQGIIAKETDTAAVTMSNNILSEDGTLPTSPAGPAAPVTTLIGEDTSEISNEGEVDVLQPPMSTPLETKPTPQMNHNMRIPHNTNNSSAAQNASSLHANTSSQWQPSSSGGRFSHNHTTCVSGSSHDKPTTPPCKSERKQLPVPGAGHAQTKRSKRFAVYLRNSMGTVHEIKVREGDTVRRLKEKVSVATNIFPQSIHLVFNGAELIDEHASVRMLGIVEGSVLSLAPRLQSGQMEMVEGCAINDETLYEKVVSHLSEKQMEQLSSGTLSKPLSFVAMIGGKRCLVRLKPAGDVASSPSFLRSLPTDAPISDPDLEPWTRGSSTADGRKKDAQWRREKQQEHKNMRACMDSVCAKLKQASAEKARVRETRTKHVNDVKASDKNLAPVPATAVPMPSKEVTATVGVPTRCHSCNGKLGTLKLPCRCTHFYCSAHRYDHKCAFDYRSAK